MNISEQDKQQLLAEGYTEQQINEAINEPEVIDNPQQYSQFQVNPTDNLVKWQIELNDILDRAEHILREDVVTVDKKTGELKWSPCPNGDRRIFNEYGVQEIMRVLSMYINRNTILSDYEPDEINNKMMDFGKEMNDLIFMKYEDFGLTNLEKRKNYPMLVRQIIDIVHSAYKRALYGGERDSLRTARQLVQQENIVPQGINIHTGEPRKERGIVNPARYLFGKYK